MVYIPAGSFVMGSPAGEISLPDARGEGGPPGGGSRGDTRHNVRLSAFCISKFLVTNAQYKLFCDFAGSQYRPGGRRFHETNVSIKIRLSPFFKRAERDSFRAR